MKNRLILALFAILLMDVVFQIKNKVYANDYSELAFFSFSSLASQNDCPDGWLNCPNSQLPVSFGKEFLFLVVHASTEWDQNKTIKHEAEHYIKNFNDINKKYRIKTGNNDSFVMKTIFFVHLTPSKYLESKRSGDSSYFLKPSPDFYYYSSGGEHSIYTKTDRVLIAGGRFNQCASETLRDLIVNNVSIKKIFFITNAIYHYLQNNQPPKLLSSFLKNKNDEDFVKWIHANLFLTINTTAGNQKVLGWVTKQGRPLYIDQYVFKIYRDNREIGQIDDGSRLAVKRMIDLHFIFDAFIAFN